MRNMTLGQIAQACGGVYIGEEQEKQTVIRGAVTDSRQVEEGFLFIPIKGAKVDGHKFIPEVCAKGAACVLSEQKLQHCGRPYILVKSGEQALKDIAKYYRSQLTIPVVGITGSVGKTSTKEMVASVLSQKYHVLKTAGNYNNEIGLPLTLLRIQKGHEAAVVEMGISDFGEMHRLAEMAQPDLCIITNIGICHLENLKTRDGVLKAKSEIFDFLKPEGKIVLNGEDDKLCSIKEAKGVRPIFYGIGGDGRQKLGVYADNIINYGLKGMGADIHTPAGSIHAHIPIPGRHNIYNALAATAAGLSLGLGLLEIKAGIESVEAIGGRTNLIETGGILVIDDCYNANPVSMRASIEVLGNGLARKVAVLGDMGELGEQEKQLHYEVGAYVAEKQIDTLFCAGELSKEMARGAREANDWCEVFHFGSRDEMVSQLLEYLQEGDTVLVKASHFMDFPKVVEAIKGSFHSVS